MSALSTASESRAAELVHALMDAATRLPTIPGPVKVSPEVPDEVRLQLCTLAELERSCRELIEQWAAGSTTTEQRREQIDHLAGGVLEMSERECAQQLPEHRVDGGSL